MEADIGRLASPWHTDADLGRPIEVVTDMSKSRRLGFPEYQPTDEAFFDLNPGNSRPLRNVRGSLLEQTFGLLPGRARCSP